VRKFWIFPWSPGLLSARQCPDFFSEIIEQRLPVILSVESFFVSHQFLILCSGCSSPVQPSCSVLQLSLPCKRERALLKTVACAVSRHCTGLSSSSAKPDFIFLLFVAGVIFPLKPSATILHSFSSCLVFALPA
jgi:hypothetical protein